MKGSHYQTPGYDESGKKAGLLDAIELNFIIQVNGRICDFTESFTLEKSEVSGEISITQLDKKVYELYGFSPDEIRTFEESMKK